MDLEEDLSDEFESKSTKAVQNGSQVSRKVLQEDNECQFCNKCFKSRRSLQMHKRTCSKNPERKKPSPVSCSYCAKLASLERLLWKGTFLLNDALPIPVILQS